MTKKMGIVLKDLWKESREESAIIFGALLLGAIIFGGGFLVDKYSCYKKSNIMNVTSDHSVFSGCMIQLKSGQYVPIESIREFDLGGE